MKGDIRTRSASSSIFLYTSKKTNGFINNASHLVGADIEEEYKELQHEKIKPYTRKWETSTMDTIHELHLVSKRKNKGTGHLQCDVIHYVPAVVFSTGGYTGNVYHEFNDGILPLYITSQHLNKKVVFVILDYHHWWVRKYRDILAHLSEYPVIDFVGDGRTHCFPEAIVGLKIHDELTVDSSLTSGNKSIADFRNLLDTAFSSRVRNLVAQETKEKVKKNQGRKPNLVILSRNGSRAITNENLLVEAARKVGFRVKVLKPKCTTELVEIYHILNSSDVMVGVHGAAMTHFLFMRPGSVLIQVIPLGTDWAAEHYFEHPAMKFGLKYIRHKILPQESSLYYSYDKVDPVLKNPESVTKRGWQYTKKIYLQNQTVKLDIKRFHKHLVRAYVYSKTKMNQHFHS
ncbi:hypothetical protein SLEP1_g36771 [Rubroshorea leprosula]|uniref:Glycosyltransferase 61 catalytic domain-containing protein n=1 Tax=Rubroshorea leprosula TaxID=152421 RepID=A0AAV5KSS0_9ROSI|nr:hypothetical protein SLEP1_g36771 [Rubroshorea leprosula]